MDNKKGISMILAMGWIAFCVLVALCAPFIMEYIIGFNAEGIDLEAGNYASPMSRGRNNAIHWLGTDLIGRDIAAGMVNGFRVSLGTAALAVIISGVLGVLSGVFSGFTGNQSVKWRWTDVLFFILGLFFFIYLFKAMILIPWYWMIPIILMVFGVSHLIQVKFLIHYPRKHHLPIDLIFMRAMEVISGLPGLLILLAISAIFESKSLAVTGIIIGLLRWPFIALIARNETQRTRKMNFIESGKALGYTHSRLVYLHILPNILTPLLIALILGFASAILIESALSFLGIGVALETQTWGSILAQSRQQISAWWLAVFPGLAIFLTVISLHTLARKI